MNDPAPQRRKQAGVRPSRLCGSKRRRKLAQIAETLSDNDYEFTRIARKPSFDHERFLPSSELNSEMNMTSITPRRRAGNRARLAKKFCASFLITCATVLWTTPADAVFRVWTGASVNWSNPNNWNPAGAPQPGDDLHFPFGVANLTSSNDIAGIALNSMLFNAPIYLRGPAVTVSNGITSSVISPGMVTVECPVVLGSDEHFFGEQRDLQFTGGINLNAHDLTINANGGNSARILVPSVISNDG